MPSLMRRYQNKVRNEGRVVAEMPKAKPSGTKGKTATNQLEALVTASLIEDLAILSAESSVARKAEIKRTNLIPKYADYVARLKEAGSTHDLLGYYLVWLFDAGMIPEALEHAAWCMEMGLNLPEKFKSAVPFFTATQVGTWAERERQAGRAVDPYFSGIFGQILNDPEGWNVPDDLLATFYRIRGLIAMDGGDLIQAESDLVEALALGAQVKTKLEAVRKKMKTQVPEGGTAPMGGTEDDSPETPPM